jgi:hypothetical protein
LLSVAAQNFTTSVYEIGAHDRYVVCQTYVAPVVTVRENIKPSRSYRDMSKDLSNSLDASDKQIAVNRQLYELRKQTRLLQKIANQ